MSSVISEIPVVDGSVSSLRPPALWTKPAYAGTIEALEVKERELAERLSGIAARFFRARFATSLAAEDMVLTDAILRGSPAVRAGIRVFTLNTGRLHAETLAVLDKVETHYGYTIEQFTPDQEAVENYLKKNGLNAFYDSVDLRKSCCGIRKVEPLNRALSHADAWMTGQRREQAVTRAELPFEETDESRGIPKFNPLADWTEAEVWAYLSRHNVPVNALHEKGYPSIGCEPCTRAVKAGEDVRAGRWWWENRDTKECGLHESNLRSVPVSAKANFAEQS